MNFQQAESLYRTLQSRRASGALDEGAFRVEVGKLLLRDRQGAFWMIDADSGDWFCNHGEGWAASDPHAPPALESAPVAGGGARPRRRGLRWAALVVALTLAAVAAVLVVLRLDPFPSLPFSLATPGASHIEVTIASPADDSRITLGQAVAVESILRGDPDLLAVARVVLEVNARIVDSQAVRPKVQPEQTSLPLSQPWRPDSLGEHEVVVATYADGDLLLGFASITLEVIEAPAERVPEPVCLPGAALVADMTIPPGTTFPPGARMDKVWRIRNTGSCAWGVGYGLVRIEGEALGASGLLPVPLTPAGESLDLTITFWAPADIGSYANVWQLESPDGQFFGPTLPLSVHVEMLAPVDQPPIPPSGLRADVMEEVQKIRLTWEDRSRNEDGFRIHRDDLEASIGLAPADVELFVDENVFCGNVYRYSVAAFNASGTSPISETVEATMPPCVLPTTTVPPTTLTPPALPGPTPSLAPGATPSPVLTVTAPSSLSATPSLPVPSGVEDAAASLMLVGVAFDSIGQKSEQGEAYITIHPAR